MPAWIGMGETQGTLALFARWPAGSCPGLLNAPRAPPRRRRGVARHREGTAQGTGHACPRKTDAPM